MYGLLTKYEVKMAGYWPSSFFCVFMDRDEVEVHKLAKKRTRPISSHLDRTNLVNKEFIIWLLVKFCLRDTAGSPERARWLHLARSGSQSQCVIWFILPAHGASHIIKPLIIWLAPRVGKMTEIAHCDGAILPARDYPLYPASKISPKAI